MISDHTYNYVVDDNRTVNPPPVVIRKNDDTPGDVDDSIIPNTEALKWKTNEYGGLTHCRACGNELEIWKNRSRTGRMETGYWCRDCPYPNDENGKHYFANEEQYVWCNKCGGGWFEYRKRYCLKCIDGSRYSQ